MSTTTLTTYGGLLAAIPSWATYNDVTAQLPDFVAWAHQEICRRLRCNLLLSNADVTIDAETVDQPAGFLAIKRFYLDLSQRRKLETVSSEGALDLSDRYGKGSYPSHVAIEGDSFRFAPLFSGSVTGKLLFYKAPDALAADADTNVVMAKYPLLYLYGSLEALFRFKEDDNNADRYGGQFGALIESINGLEGQDTMAGSLQSASGGANP